ncbi:MAG: AAA family ATPase [Paludibacteraceae bacterium]|nr:AAA family ATPase [Paludibacteraceae bacterium]
MPALQVYVDADDWVKTADYIDKEYNILKNNGVESQMKDDKTDYTKDAEIPRYFGFVERRISGDVKSDCRITSLGKKFYYAVINKNQNDINESIMMSLESVVFGKNNDGCPGSNTRLEAPNILMMSSFLLGGISRQEYAGILYDMLNNNTSIVNALVKVKIYREKKRNIVDKVRVDNKIIPFLVNIGFLVDDGSLIKISEKVLEDYQDRISKLPTSNDLGFISIDNNMPLGSFNHFPLQQIFYGAPGTGKSFSIKSVIAEHMNINVDQVDMEADNIFRTTFHPDYDYAQFVGCYKPTKEKNGDITYDFVPQVFVNALVEAYGGVQPAKSSSNTSATTDQVADGETKKDDLNEEETVVEQTVESEVETQAVKPVYLVIEEINRGNCAQIFGDIFQLLDRDANGVSEYSISVDKDLREYLEINCPNAICNGKIKIPANLSIIATMNTSDQSLFPMDSAFKRRWEWEYVKIENKTDFEIEVDATHKYNWKDFQKAVNDIITVKTNSEDKQMGDYFIKKNVTLNEFVNKVMFYLWNDICKENYHTDDNFFRTEDESTGKETEFSFGEMMADKVNKINGFMRKLKVKNLIEISESTDASDVSTPESSAE